jgi:hypothetical protein
MARSGQPGRSRLSAKICGTPKASRYIYTCSPLTSSVVNPASAARLGPAEATPFTNAAPAPGRAADPHHDDGAIRY